MNEQLRAALDERNRALKTFTDAVTHRLDDTQSRIEELEVRARLPGRTTDGGGQYSRADNEHKSVFFDWIRRPTDERCKARLAEAQHEILTKDVSIGSLPGGGYALPKEIATQIERRVRQLNPFRELVDVVQCSSNDFHYLVSLGDGTSGWSSETGTRNATNSPNLRDIAPTFGELYALPTASNWSLEDPVFDVQRWLVEDISADWSAAEATAIISGNGTDKPTGCLNTTPVTTADDASPMRAQQALQYIPLTGPSSPVAINIDSLIDLIGAIKERYVQESDRCAFVMHRTTAARLRKLKASTAGSYHWEPSTQAGMPERLLGYRVATCDGMPQVANDNFAVVFGNWRRGYLLADRTGMAITVDPYSTPGKTRFYARRRVGGKIKNNDALKVLRISDT
jgi:HK97 family phage major capsid protein